VWGGIFPRLPENRWYSGKAIPLLETLDGRALVDTPRKDDHLLTWKLDRLGRRNKDILVLMDPLVEKGVRIICLDQGGVEPD
jgi:hypothetical protein